jgi:hypothetical protein
MGLFEDVTLALRVLRWRLIPKAFNESSCLPFTIRGEGLFVGFTPSE